jgi:hypothetical protein
MDSGGNAWSSDAGNSIYVIRILKNYRKDGKGNYGNYNYF